jgi:poly(A) polymerase
MSTNPAWLSEAPLQQLLTATRAAGGEARVVGGAVRDWLMGIEGADLSPEALAKGDVDVASTLTPEQTMAIAAQQNWKAIPTGIEHGTVTLVLPNRVVEVTTLRRDVTTDGRRATVAFTNDWREDAARRDFTINAMSMDADGVVYDYFDGKNDIAHYRVVFIGDAAQRIAEDALRVLRFFRFLATHGKPPADADALAAIAAQKGMIENLSGERIANEMRKLLAADAPAYALRLMHEQGVAALVFGSSIDPSRMIRLQLLEGQADYQCSVWARAVVLCSFNSPLEGESHRSCDVVGGADVPQTPQCVDGLPPHGIARAMPAPPQGGSKEIAWLAHRWKLSRNEAKQLAQLVQLPAFRQDASRHFHTRILRLHGAPVYLDWLLTQAAMGQGVDVAPFVQLAHDFVPPIFPITAKDLMAQGMKEGKALGDRLSLLEMKWEESDYTLTKKDLLAS